MRKKIGYDASFAINQYRGMGVFINAVKDVLIKHPNITVQGFSCYKTSDPSVITFGSKLYPLWEQFSLPKFLKQHKPEIFIFPYNTMPWKVPSGIKKILIIHDVIFLQNSTGGKYTLKQWVGRHYRKLLVKRAYKQADTIITVSEYSKNEIIKYLGGQKQIHVIPNVLKQALEYKGDNATFAEQKYFLNVGGEAPSKNISTLIEAYCSLQTEIIHVYSLKLVGQYSSSYKEKVANILKENKIAPDKIEFCGYVTNEQLAALYANCRLFIFPSLQEGFGIPIIEAMQFNKPMVVSNASCIPEIAGKGAVYFDPISVNDIREKIEYTLSGKYDFDIYTGYYLEQMKKFSWEVFERKVNDLITKNLHL